MKQSMYKCQQKIVLSLLNEQCEFVSFLRKAWINVTKVGLSRSCTMVNFIVYRDRFYYLEYNQCD